MALITLTFPPGTVATTDGVGPNDIVVSVNLTEVTIVIDDIDGNGTIDNTEWDAFAPGGGGGDHGGTNFLFDGSGGDGILYALDGTTFTVTEDVTAIVASLSNSFEADVSNVVCFAGGTQITTERGSVPIEKLRVGDSVLSRDSGLQPIKWIGRRKLSHAQLITNPKLRPICLKQGAMGRDLPKRDLLVSRQHRMLISSPIAERMFGCKEALVPAIKLTELPGIYVDEEISEVEYFHILFEKHEIIFAEGAPSESLFTGPEALKSIPKEGVKEILGLFPEIADLDYAPTPAGFIPKGSQQTRLIERHAKTRNRYWFRAIAASFKTPEPRNTRFARNICGVVCPAISPAFVTVIVRVSSGQQLENL